MVQHIMIDLETFSTAGDAGIVQIGAQAYDPTAPEEAVLRGPGICLNIDPQAIIDAGMRIDWSTLYWWMSQPDAFATLAAPGDGILLSSALTQLSAYINANGGSWAKIWANGAAFDPPILEASYRRCRMSPPWQYNNILDVRTMKWLAPSVARVEPELAHNALSDCRAQALFVARCYAALKVGNEAPAGEELRQEPLEAATTTAPTVESIPEDLPVAKSELLLFYERLEGHDWWYMMSDDATVYNRGLQAEGGLQAKVRQGGAQYDALYLQYANHIRSGGSKPEKPAG